MADVRVRVLGGVRLRGPVGDVAVGGVIAERLLGALVASGGAPVLSDVLAEVLWPDAAPPDPDPPLRMAVSRLRQRLVSTGIADGIVGTRRAYRLAVALEEIDADRFVTLIGQARHASPSWPADAAALYEAALELWEGEPFGELAAEPWAETPAARLRELRWSAEEELADVDLRRHREAAIIERLRVAAEEQPLRERRWVQLTTALYRLGRQAEALRAVARARTILREELGIDPGADLRAVEQAVLAHDPALLAGEPATPRPHLVSGPLVGRDGDVAEVHRLLGMNRVVTVHGLGGVGKSAVARAVAARIALDGTAVVAARLDGVVDREGVAVAIAEATDLGGSEDEADTVAAVAGRVGRQPTLLLLDGAEGAPDAATELADALLLMVPSLRVLVTARVPIGISAEVRYALEPLPFVGGDTPAPAVSLFLARAGVAPDRLDGDAIAAITRICRVAAGLPLAIELAAATVDRYDLAELAAVAEAAEGRAAGAVRDAVRWSVGALPEVGEALLHRVPYLPGGVSLSGVARLVDVEDSRGRSVIAPLVQARLLYAATGPGVAVRYRALEPVRDAILEITPADAAAGARASAWEYVFETASAVGEMGNRLNLDALPLAEEELGNLRHWLRVTLGSTDGLRLAVAAARVFTELGLGAEGRRWLREHRAAAHDADAVLRARATGAAADTHGFFGSAVIDPAELGEAVAVAEEAAEWRLWIVLMARLGVVKVWTGDTAGALAIAESPVARRRIAELDDPYLDVSLAATNAVRPFLSGDFAAARGRLEGVADRYLELGDPSAAAQILYLQAAFARLAQDEAAAADSLAAAYELCATGAARAIRALVSADLAHLARQRGDRGAPGILAEAIAALERAGDVRAAAGFRCDLGRWMLADGDRTNGLAHLRVALPLLLRHTRGVAAVAIAEIANAIRDDSPLDAALLAGAADELLRSPEGGIALSVDRRQVIEGALIDLREQQPEEVAAGAALDDVSLLALASADTTGA